MLKMGKWAVAIWVMMICNQPVFAQDFRAVAQVNIAESEIKLSAHKAQVSLNISQSVPFRISALDMPPRLVVDFNEVDFTGVARTDIFPQADTNDGLRFGAFDRGWSRLILELGTPMTLNSADMKVLENSAGAIIDIQLSASNAEDFANWASESQAKLRGIPKELPRFAPKPRQNGERPLVVVIDAGHGGIDSGAEREGVRESSLVLTFAKELQSLLQQEGGMEVHLTRDRDIFVPLQARVSFARKMNADVFLSIHADALEKGRATGTSIYTLSDEASDAASHQLAQSQDRGDLLAGVDLTGQDDKISELLMEMVRRETTPRTDMLAAAMLDGIRTSLGSMHRRPHLKAGFSVLRAADIPSVLIELGFMSSSDDLAQMLDPGWRDQISFGILLALQSWKADDAEAATLIRK